jgi:heterodisulfide reductase subunit D
VGLRADIDRTKAYLCLECGICTGSCPVSRIHPEYSPRLTVERALLFGEEETVCDPELWSCLTCGTCDLRCPSTVDFTGFMRALRARARELGEEGVCTHADTLAALGELMLCPDFNRSSAWLGKGLKVRGRAKTYYFAGCLPFLDVVFRDIGFEGKEIARSSVRLLNRLGIAPAVSGHEVCCGHDAYWTGKPELTRELARRNLDAIRETGAEEVVFSCPECYYMFKHVYPDLVGDLGFEVVYLLDLLAQHAERLGLKPHKAKVTYHDPCRLARMDDIIDQPRALLGAVPELELAEMERTGKDALCCGSSGFVSCSRVNKRIQVERIDEAIETGAEMLLTACPKCNIHLRCALRDEDTSGTIEIKDIVTLLAETAGGGKRGA